MKIADRYLWKQISKRRFYIMITSGLGNMIKFAVNNKVSKCFRYEETSLIGEL